MRILGAIVLVLGASFGCASGNDAGTGSPGRADCQGGYSDCGGVCADLLGDGQNCGACGAVCLAGEVCSAGACAASCTVPGQTQCGTSCVDSQTNPNHCGGCGVACGATQVCESGVCQDDLGTGGPDAGGTNSGGSGGTSAGGTSAGGSGGTSVGGSGGTSAGGSGGGGATEDVPPCVTNEISSCSGTSEIACHFGGEPGDYRVTVELGGDAAGDMYVDAEMYRRMLGRTTTTAGQSRRFSFVTNVRVYEGQPVDPDQKGSSKGIPGLDIYVRGAHPGLVSICREKVTPAPKVWLAGDSTVCDQAGTDYSGWGQHLPQFFQSPVSIANYADSGESSASFLGGAKLWKAITAGWKSGDWVLIQLGHNDKTITAAAFKANLKSMVTQAKAAGVHPVLATPISRAATALASQHISSTGANLPQIIRDLGVEEGVPVLDLTVTTSEWLGQVDWKSFFALGTDRTHPNPAGADVIAGFVADAIGEQQLALAAHLR